MAGAGGIDMSGAPDLERLAAMIWDALEASVDEPGSPFRTAALASLGESGPAVRLVVLREVDPFRRTLSFCTDWRSPKRIQMESDPRVSWLFYDPASEVQVRVYGRVALDRDSEAVSARWGIIPDVARLRYASPLSPGSPIDAPLGLPRDPDSGRGNFTRVTCTVDAMDWLRLDPTGHLRAGLRWSGSGWCADWLAP